MKTYVFKTLFKIFLIGLALSIVEIFLKNHGIFYMPSRDSFIKIISGLLVLNLVMYISFRCSDKRAVKSQTAWLFELQIGTCVVALICFYTQNVAFTDKLSIADVLLLALLHVYTMVKRLSNDKESLAVLDPDDADEEDAN